MEERGPRDPAVEQADRLRSGNDSGGVHAGGSGSSGVERIPRNPGTSAALVAIPGTIEHRSPNASTCPFFRSVDDGGRLGPPVEEADAANRCGAFGESMAQSSRQQALVCLTAGHTDCPRFLRGALALREAALAGPPARTLTRATIAALALLGVSAGASFAFVVARGSLMLPASSSVQVAAATSTPATSVSTPSVVATPARTPVPSLAPTPVATVAPIPPPTVRPTVPTTPEPTVPPAPPAETPRPEPTSARYALLDPCPTRPRCWIYTVRGGDNLYSIGSYFGHSLDTVYRLNPWTRTTPLRAGQQLVLPPPNR